MKTTELKAGFQSGKYAELLKDIYIDESVIAHQEERYVKAMAEYQKLYGDREVEVYSAPGRSEVGGNHTDHQHGHVLAAAVNLDFLACVALNGTSVVHFQSEGWPMTSVDLADLEVKEEEKETTASLIFLI